MNEFIDANRFMNKKYLRNLKETLAVKKRKKNGDSEKHRRQNKEGSIEH